MKPECCLKSEIAEPICICPHEELFSVIGKKWAVLILEIIHSLGAPGYNEVFGKISGITPKAFGDKLRVLEKNGLIERKIVSQEPLRTEYSLTSEGGKLLANLRPFFDDSLASPHSAFPG